MDTYTSSLPQVAENAMPAERAAFIRRTYSHLAGALLALVALLTVLFQTSFPEQMAQSVAVHKYGWLMVLGAFMVVSWVADYWARSGTSAVTQYAGLGLYVVAQALLLCPLLYIASSFYDGVILNAAIITGALFLGLTSVVFITQQDFSFMRPFLVMAGFVAIGVIVAGVIFGFELGLVFSGLMILFAGGYILYDTSNVLHHYRTDQHVSASLALFASVALLFWYLLRLLMSLRD